MNNLRENPVHTAEPSDPVIKMITQQPDQYSIQVWKSMYRAASKLTELKSYFNYILHNATLTNGK